MARSLSEWEAYIAPLFKRVRLLGEIPLSQGDFEDLSDEMRVLVKRTTNIPDATRRLLKNYPLTFVTFLAHFAAHNTHRDFWYALGHHIGSNSTDLTNAIWRKHFLSILKLHNKPTFEDVGGISNKYVTAIRVHGGIPVYSLNDFFANMLLPSVEKPEYISLKGAELRDALLKRSSVRMFTDSIVRNFFDTTEEIGLEFLETCRKMAQHYQKEQLIPSGLDLPVYVVDAFINFMEKQQDENVRLKRPRLLFDESEGILLDLPEQPLSGVTISTAREAFWRVETDENDKPRDERVRIGKQGRDNITEGRQIPLHPISHVHISFHLQGDETVPARQLRRWTFNLIPADDMPQLLIFRHQDSSLLHWSQTLPAEELLLLYPRDVVLKPEENSRILHEPDSLSGSWRGWHAEYWALAAGFLRLVRDDEEIALIPIQGKTAIPQLVGPEPFALNSDPKEVPLYVGEVPRLRIPIRSNRLEDRKRWIIELSSIWDANPQIRAETNLEELAEHLHQEEDYLELDLRTLLGKTPTGTFNLHVRSASDVDIEFRFRLWESLILGDLPEIIFPPIQTSRDSALTKFSITLPVSASCELQAGALGINISGQYGRYIVEVEEGVTRADLQLVRPHDGLLIQVPLFVPVPRLEWRLSMGDENSVAWTTFPIKRSIDTFLQAAQSIPVSLLLRLHNVERFSHQVAVYLVDSNHPETVLQSDFKLERSPLGEGHIRFNLGAHDTLRGHPELSVFEFQLGIPDPAHNWAERRIPLLTLTRALEISNVRIETTKDTEILRWEEPRPLNNRRVYIRSPWQPWEKGWDIDIPDSARGEFDLLSAGYALPHSRYEIYFYVAAEWEPKRTSAPHQACEIVQSAKLDEHLAWLDSKIKIDSKHAFRWCFEKACVNACEKDTQKRDEAINQCFSMLDQATFAQLLDFHDWLADYDPNTQKAVRMKLYRPERLEKLFTETKPSDPLQSRYLKHITSLKTISPETALILVRSTDDPLIMMHSLSSLIKTHSPDGVKSIVDLLKNGKLSDADAADLLALDMSFSYQTLVDNPATPEHWRLLSILIQRREDKSAFINSLSNDNLLALAKIESNPDAVKMYLAELIRREDHRGIESVMSLFQQTFLRGDEVSELLGKNPKFSYDILVNAPYQQAHQAQIEELMRKHPASLGFVALGMYVLTPGGWGLIKSIQDAEGKNLESVRSDAAVIYGLDLHPLIESEPATLDMVNSVLVFPDAKRVYKCTKCVGYITQTERQLKEHNHIAHQGINLSYSSIAPRVSVISDLEFKENI